MVTYVKNQLSDCTTVAQRDKIVLSEMCEQVKDEINIFVHVVLKVIIFSNVLD